ncbi:MAG: multifunctional CCA tRNA nucleotidyl transferase/2'3'-cyclic phosphodiesterase/2'nucleotidase/phosphatase [Polaromonas sp.]|nr:multifunctional CCA tRNA nucleotidyl transferase/2'3'-cyclic phosphodiesterase/2'nucleotidase/phosphatase [Polaromonas sp.]
MQIYLVGGAVRDALLGLPVQDRDWVVVGATAQALVERGFVPVGKDFPVFLHPRTGEEFALARTERKTARGYRGFVVHAEPDVTLEQDLARRDLTINSIAAYARGDWVIGQFEPDFGALTDPFGGQADLRAGVLRHVTDAFREDPVRILRVARFAARFADFSVAPETAVLMRQMVEHGEVGALVAERVWQELARGLMETTPSRMLGVLHHCGALSALLPELLPAAGTAEALEQTQSIVDLSARRAAPLAVRFACLCLAAGAPESAQRISARWRVPNDCRELAVLVLRERAAIDAASGLDASAAVALLERCDAVRKPARLEAALLACACASAVQLPPQRHSAALTGYQRLRQALEVALAVKTEPVALAAQAAGCDGQGVGAAIHAARVDSVKQRWQENE